LRSFSPHTIILFAQRLLCTWGFTHMPSTCNAKSFGYSQGIQLTDNAGQKSGKEAAGKAE
ncbi:MAG: hypothetical protein ACRC8O_03060, partial [Plesiomonas shigelloides]